MEAETTRRAALTAVLVVATAWGGPAVAQEETPAADSVAADSAAVAADTVVGADGVLIERIAATADTTQAYALYLPPGHSAEREWPVLALMDPRGRALVPLEIFRPVAERLGYVILSSYNTSSDQHTSGEDTERGVEAMLDDAMGPRSLDSTRVYLVGFSGTARVGWHLANNFEHPVPGLIGFGGGFSQTGVSLYTRSGRLEMAYFGAAGRHGFNYRLVRAMDDLLDGTAVRHRIRGFDGGHQWPPEAVATEAVEWMKVQAQRDGLEPVDTAWVTGRYRAELDTASALRRADRLYDAWLRYRQAAEGFDGVVDVSEARDSTARLADENEVEETLEEMREWEEWELSFIRARVAPMLDALSGGGSPPSLGFLASRIQLDDLHEQTEADDTLAAQAATRMLTSTHVNVAFYRPRQLLAGGKPAHALRSLELAYRINPDTRPLCRWWRELPEEVRKDTEVEALATECDAPEADEG